MKFAAFGLRQQSGRFGAAGGAKAAVLLPQSESAFGAMRYVPAPGSCLLLFHAPVAK